MGSNNSFADWHFRFVKGEQTSASWPDVEKQEISEEKADIPGGVVCSWTFKLTWRGLFALVLTLVAGMNLYTFHSAATHLNYASVKEKLMMSRSLLEGASFYLRLKMSHQDVPVYYINLKSGIQRREYMEEHLNSLNILSKRVEAFTYPQDPRAHVNQHLISIQSQLSPNNNEIACIISHLIAIYDAVHDQDFFPDSKWAVIMEDDVHFEFNVNLFNLISNAPEDFHVLQLMTSNDEQVVKMFYEYVLDAEFALLKHNETAPDEVNHATFDRHVHRKMWSRREPNLWSTQAYVIHKDHVRGVIDSIVSKNEETGHYTINFQNSAENTKYCRPSNRDCYRLYPSRLVADIYLYDVLGNTYASKLPLMNGGNIEGYQSTIQTHGDKEAAVNRAFGNIGRVIGDVKTNGDWLLPSSVELLPDDAAELQQQ